MKHRHSHSDPLAAPGADAVELAGKWLNDHYEEALHAAINAQFFFGVKEDKMRRLALLPAMIRAMIDTNSGEYMLAEGFLDLPAGPAACLDLVLGPAGPRLDAPQRHYLEALGSRPMSLYRVVESDPDRGLRVRDLLDAGEPRRWVADPLASVSLACQPGRSFGGRLIPGDPWRLGRALYPADEPQLAFMLEQIRGARQAPDPPGPERAVRNLVIVYTWLTSLANTPLEVFDDRLREEVH